MTASSLSSTRHQRWMKIKFRHWFMWLALPVVLVLAACGGAGAGSSSSPSLAAATIGPTPTPEPRSEQLRVKSLTSSSLNFAKGDYVWIVAQGEIKVGAFVGYVDPDGRDTWLLSGYNIVPDAPHGGLLCRLKGQTEWSFCGSDTEFQPEESGQLEFQVNDREQENNDPDTYFEVVVIAAPYSVRAGYLASVTPEAPSQNEAVDSSGSTTDPQANVPPPNDSQDCMNPSVNAAYSTECSVIVDRENGERFMAEREAEYQRQREEEQERAREQRENMP